MKMIGVGFGRTGTLSLKQALERLGAPCLHMLDLIDGTVPVGPWHDAAFKGRLDFDGMFAGFEATVDWPGCTYWRELADAYPDTPLLLNVRGFDGWYASCRDTLFAIRQAAQAGELDPSRSARELPPPELWEVIGKQIWELDFGGRFEDVEWMRDMYSRRIETIRATVDPDRLIVFDFEASPGWAPLCEVLGVPEPDEPFPHLHDTDEFRTSFGLAPLAG